MNGMEMLLQSFGVNTEEVKANVDSAVKLVTLMNEQLAHIKESIDRVEAKVGQQSQTLAWTQAKMTDLDGQVILLNDWVRRDEWPPQVTQTVDELNEVVTDARRTEGASSNAASRDHRRGA